jgi:hypothetical protein
MRRPIFANRFSRAPARISAKNTLLLIVYPSLSPRQILIRLPEVLMIAIGITYQAPIQQSPSFSCRGRKICYLLKILTGPGKE